jgi:Fic/DOC family.
MLDLDKAPSQVEQPETTEDQEYRERTDNTEQLVRTIVGRNAEYFAEPTNRLEFIKGQSAAEFFSMAQYVNAKLRGEKAHELRHHRPAEKDGAFLPILHTPASSDKPEAFARGYAAIQEYLDSTDDPTEKQIEGTAMATEALIIWVHPFADGNGRTSRFIAKLIEEGGTDTEALIAETASNARRPMDYRGKLATKESRLADADNEDLMYDDDERAELRASAEQLPDDIEGMYLSIKRLLETDEVRQDSARHYRKLGKIARMNS